MAQVFVSYKHEDNSKGFIQHLRQKLEEAEFDVWIDSVLLLPGEDWKKEIDNAIKASIALIVIMTPEARKSEYVTYEWAFAAGREIPVIPVLLQKMDLHPRLNDIQYVDFSIAWGDGVQVNWDKLISKLKSEVSKYEKRNEVKKIPPAILQIIDELNSPIAEVRKEALQSLSSMLPHDAAVETLSDLLSNHLYPDVREGAAYALASLQRHDLTPIFKSKLSDTHKNVVRSTIFALQQLNTDEAFNILIGAFDNNADTNVIYSMIDAFGNFGRPEAIPLLEQCLDNGKIARFAIWALVQIGTPECQEIIKNSRQKFTQTGWEEVVRVVGRLEMSEDFANIFAK